VALCYWPNLSAPLRDASPSHTQPLPTGPCCHPAPLVSHRTRVTRAPPPSTVTRQHRRLRPPAGGRRQLPEPFPYRTKASSSFPFPPSTQRPPPDPLPPTFLFCRAPERVQKASVAVPLSSPLRSFTPMLKHTATSPVLLRIGSLTSNARASLLPP
jgi:hypothetical protein